MVSSLLGVYKDVLIVYVWMEEAKQNILKDMTPHVCWVTTIYEL